MPEPPPKIAEPVVTFAPSRSEGLPQVTEVSVYPDRVEVVSGGQRIAYRFAEIATASDSRGVAWLLGLLRLPVALPKVGDFRFCKKDYASSFVRFSTPGHLTMYMPADGPAAYPNSHFWRTMQTVRAGGYYLADLDRPTDKAPRAAMNLRQKLTVGLLTAGVTIAAMLLGGHTFTVVAGLLTGTMLIGIVHAALRGLIELPGWRKLAWIAAMYLVAAGVVGFLGSFLAAGGGLNALGSFEWPIGYSSSTLRMADGSYIVPHVPSGRVQVYGPDLVFQRGWHIEAWGGYFALHLRNANTIDIYTARRKQHYVYTVGGQLLASDTYTGSAPPSPAYTSLTIPTQWWLYPLVHPFAAMASLLVGAGLAHLLSRENPLARSDRFGTTTTA